MEFELNSDLVPEILKERERTLTFFRKCYVGRQLEAKLYIIDSPMAMWGPCPAVIATHKLWQEYSIKDYKSRIETEKTIYKLQSGIGEKKWAFVTVGFDDNQAKPDPYDQYHLMKSLAKQMIERKFITNGKFVIEKHRKDAKGDIYIHHHIHFLIETDKPKSKLVQYFAEVFKRYIAGKNFIDVKTQKDNVGTYEQKLKYLEGDKADSKIECVELDTKWRESCEYQWKVKNDLI